MGKYNINKGSFVKDTKWMDTWLSARMKQAAAKQALSIVKSQIIILITIGNK
ncbi:hypothetical protein GMMP15_1710008 [Candidatus Magnetomoraceae bacterium gMMP-15]